MIWSLKNSQAESWAVSGSSYFFCCCCCAAEGRKEGRHLQTEVPLTKLANITAQLSRTQLLCGYYPIRSMAFLSMSGCLSVLAGMSCSSGDNSSPMTLFTGSVGYVKKLGHDFWRPTLIHFQIFLFCVCLFLTLTALLIHWFRYTAEKADIPNPTSPKVCDSQQKNIDCWKPQQFRERRSIFSLVSEL